MQFRSIVTSALVFLLVPHSAFAGYILFGKSKVSFFATGTPGTMSFEGKTSSITLADDGQKLIFTVPMDGVKTGIDLRDKHMNERYVETAKFPNATLEVERGAVLLPATGTGTGTAPGTFTVHGVPVPVTVTWSAEKAAQGWKVKASFPFDVTASSVTIPSYVGVTIDPAMRTEVTLNVAEAP